MASLGTDIAPVKNETLADGIEFMESRLKTLKADLEAIRDRAMYALKTDRAVAGTPFDAVEVQRLPLYQAFYQAYYAESRWQMPSM